MMPEAFVLFKTEPTHEREVYLTLSDHDGVADLARFPHPDLRCDHVKRRLVDQRRYEVTSDRHIVWT